MLRWPSSILMIVLLSGCVTGSGNLPSGASLQTDPVTFVSPPIRNPEDLQVLFWTSEERAQRFREMENWFEGHEVLPPVAARVLPAGDPLSPTIIAEINRTMKDTGIAGVMVLQDGKKRFEGYELGFTPDQRWTSFSVAKSFTSTLLGAAIQDGFIGSLQDPITKYIPELDNSAYEGVTVEHLATMTSGVTWNEDYTDPNSDVAMMARFVLEYGDDAIVEQMKQLPREANPGTKWVYKTGETNLLGMLVENAIGLPLAAYAKTKIVDPAGFEANLFWMSDPRGGSIGGCCISLRLADYARMGQFALDGGSGIVPDGWFSKAGDSLIDFGESGFGYGYQWWTYPDNNYAAQGIFGQLIMLIPEDNIVLAVVGNWDTARSSEGRTAWRLIGEKIALSR